MSSRTGRALLKLYPRAVRERYGRELLALQDQLRARGELSRRRLLWDMVMGSLAFRRARLMCLTLVGGLVIAGIATAAVTGAGHGRGPSIASGPVQVLARLSVRPRRVVDLPPMPFQHSGSCFVGSGSCSESACTEYTARASAGGRVATRSARRPVTGTRCAARSHLLHPRPLFVSG